MKTGGLKFGRAGGGRPAVLVGGALPTVTFAAATVSATEGNSGAKLLTFTATRTSTAGAATAPVAFSAGGTNAADFTGGVLPSGLSFAWADGAGTATLSISVNGDTAVESDESFTLTMTAPSGYGAGAIMSATGTILNDDAAAQTGTSASRYSVMGTGLRQQTNLATVPTGFPAVCSSFSFYCPDYPTSAPRFFMPTYYSLTAGQTVHEIATTAVVTITGIAVRINGGSWTDLNPSLFPITIDPSVDTAGKLLPALTDATFPANALVECRISDTRTEGATMPRGLVLSGYSSRGFSTSAAAQAARTDNTVLNNTNGVTFYPSAMIALGGDGRPAILAVGDSIGYGADHTSAPSTGSARLALGYLETGLDENVVGKRIALLNLCVPGQGPKQWSITTNIGKKLAMLQALCSANTGGKAAWDEILCQHGTNSSENNLATFLSDYRNLYSIFRSASNDNAMPVTQTEMIAYPVSTDGYAALAGQSPNSANTTYPNGIRWQVNQAIGGPDGLGDPTATLRADNSIQSSFAPWRKGSYDTASNRDKVRVYPFSATLAADYSGTGTMSMTASPAIGADLLIRHSGGTMNAIVTNVTGAGPYTVTFVSTGGNQAITAANVLGITESAHGGGLHPGPRHHILYYAASVAEWKAARGWAA